MLALYELFINIFKLVIIYYKSAYDKLGPST